LMASGSPMGAGQPAVHLGARWETPEWFVVRTAGLPSQVLEELCCNRTYHLVAELALEAQWLATEGRRLADAVEDIIAGLEGGLNPRLVGRPRALSQSNPVGRCVRLMENALPKSVAESAWRGDARRDEHARRLKELPAILEAELRDKRESLRRIASRSEV